MRESQHHTIVSCFVRVRYIPFQLNPELTSLRKGTLKMGLFYYCFNKIREKIQTWVDSVMLHVVQKYKTRGTCRIDTFLDRFGPVTNLE